MSITIDWIAIIAASVMAVGIIEYLKGLFIKAPSWVWLALSPVSAIVASVSLGGAINQIAINAGLVLAVSQLCYQSIVQLVKSKVAK